MQPLKDTGYWRNRKVVVTGAGGFIGSHLCEALVQQGAKVTAIVRYNSNNSFGNLELLDSEVQKAIHTVSGNIEDRSFVEHTLKDQQTVFHLAALIGIPYSYLAPESYVNTNIKGTLNILEAVKTYGCEKLVHTSTSETYGTAQYTPMDENHPLQAQSPYAASKVGADKLAQSYYLSFKLPVTTLRPFNTFGPRQSARAVIPTIISQAAYEKEIRLGSLEPVRDLLFVKDTVEAFLAVARAPDSVGKTFNAGTGIGTSVGDLVKKIQTAMKSKVPVRSETARIRPQHSEVLELICDATQLKAITGWQPRYSLDQGLFETIEFVLGHRERFKTDRYAV